MYNVYPKHFSFHDQQKQNGTCQNLQCRPCRIVINLSCIFCKTSLFAREWKFSLYKAKILVIRFENARFSLTIAIKYSGHYVPATRLLCFTLSFTDIFLNFFKFIILGVNYEQHARFSSR